MQCALRGLEHSCRRRSCGDLLLVEVVRRGSYTQRSRKSGVWASNSLSLAITLSPYMQTYGHSNILRASRGLSTTLGRIGCALGRVGASSTSALPEMTRAGLRAPFGKVCWLSGSSVSAPASKLCVVTLNGADRRGIVHRFTAEVSKHGGNFEESRMVRLGGEFAIMSLLTVSTERLEELRKALEGAFPDYSVTCRETREEPVVETDVRMLEISVEGPDQPGIVRSLTEALVPFQAHIESMETETVPAPFAGWPLFRLKAQVSVPRSTSVGTLEEALSREVEEKFDLLVDVSSIPVRKQRNWPKKPTGLVDVAADAQHAT
jgi:glycine cleavage system transcriptional repressor